MSTNSGLYQLKQRQRILAVILWITFLSTIVLGLLNIQYRTWASVIALCSMSILCIPALAINARGNTIAAAWFITLITLLVININIIDGDGVHDFGLLGYPIFIMVGALFFGKRVLPIFSLAAVISVLLVIYLEMSGYVRPTLGPAKVDDFITIIILLGLAATVVWVIIDAMEKNLSRLSHSEAELLETYDLTLEAWAKVIELRDKETEGHSRRLVELSTRLAKTLGFTDEQISELRRGALLHDIGKLAIPDSILFKPGSLDESDRRVIEKHPDFARDLLADIPFLKPSISVAYSHHERWDGKGYPQGLKGEEIPLPARIFAVVDIWDALGTDRVYRPAWSQDRIIAYLKENSGTIFDPHLVDVFLTIV